MNTKIKRATGVGVLLTSYSALIGGLFGLAANPLLAVLLVLGGTALSICSAVEIVEGPGPDAATPQKITQSVPE